MPPRVDRRRKPRCNRLRVPALTVVKARFQSLDVLRGLAELTVVFLHYLLIFPTFDNLYGARAGEFWILKWTPLKLLYAGHEAVIFFFVLSGFVLALPYFGAAARPALLGFWAKRLARIYPALWFALGLAWIATGTLHTSRHPEFGTTFKIFWNHFPGPAEVVANLAVVTPFDFVKYDPVVWTLTHEVRLSLIFPLIVMLIARGQGKRLVAWGCAAAFIVSFFADGVQSLQMTFFYSTLFVFGALLAKNRDRAVAFTAALPNWKRWSALVGALCLYTSRWWLFPTFALIHLQPIGDWEVGIAALVLISLAIGWPAMDSVLRVRPLVLLGRMSYSLYLLHAVVLLGAISLLYPRLPIWAVMSLSLPATLLISYGSYLWIERPTIKFGHWAAGRLVVGVGAPRPSEGGLRLAPAAASAPAFPSSR